MRENYNERFRVEAHASSRLVIAAGWTRSSSAGDEAGQIKAAAPHAALGPIGGSETRDARLA